MGLPKEMRVTTTVPSDIWEQAKQRGIPIRMLVIRGWQAEQNFPALLERQRELEDKMHRYQAELELTHRKLYELQAKKERWEK